MNTLLDLGPQPRVLFLAQSARRVREQLAGRTLTLAEAGPLRDDISTDEITPVRIMSHYDDSLARFPYTGFTVEGERPIAPGAVQAGGFRVAAGGRRYGKGSSREHSPAAEKLAGIRLVVAESFERIYRQNADNIGLFTSTDLGLVERLRRGEAGQGGRDDRRRGDDDEGAFDAGRQVFRLGAAVGVLLVRRRGGEPQHPEREHRGAKVDEGLQRVGQQSHRAGQPPRPPLDDERGDRGADGKPGVPAERGVEGHSGRAQAARLRGTVRSASVRAASTSPAGVRATP